MTPVVRLPGASRVIREALSGSAPLAAAVTVLGDGAVLAAVLAVALLAWPARRREVGLLAAIASVTMALMLAVKWLLGFPRPPMSARPLAIAPVTPGFPSGHATMSTLVYGGLVLVHRRHVPSEGTVAAAVAGVVVVVVSLSRIVLGVHYLGDVLAGLLVGAVVLACFAVGQQYVVEGTVPW